MIQPRNLEELIEYMEQSWSRMEDDFDIICSFYDKDNFELLLADLKTYTKGENK